MTTSDTTTAVEPFDTVDLIRVKRRGDALETP